MKRWWASWPMLVAAIVTVLNVELVLIPTFIAFGIRGGALFACTAVTASIEVSYWYWFAGWLGRQAPFIPVVRSTVSEFRGRGLLAQVSEQLLWGAALAMQVWTWFVGHIRSHMEASRPIPRWLLARALGIIRTSPTWMMFPMMIGLGLCPLGWVPGILICRQHRVRGAFPLLLILNAIKTFGVGLGWATLLTRVGAGLGS